MSDPTAKPLRPSAASGITATLVVCLGCAQIISWGTMHYLVSVFGPAIQAELGWSAGFVHGGFSCALAVMGLSSVWVGRRIDKHGGRAPMMAGCVLGAAGCVTLAAAHHGTVYYMGWVLLGLGMRLALYDAAFAALAHLGGPASRQAMSQVTLFGGLSSTIFWPLGQWLGQEWGWRSALAVYALLLLASSLLYLALPRGHGPDTAGTAPGRDAPDRPAARADVLLYGCIATLALFIQTGMSAHLPGILRGLGWTPGMAVSLSALFGIGQVAGRVGIAATGRRARTLTVNLLPCLLLCLCFAAGLAAGATLPGALAFTLLYGAGNGMATIMRGAIPLALFDARNYGRIVGGVLRPAFMLSAAAPVCFALVIGHVGHAGLLAAALAMATAQLAAALLLRHRHQDFPS